MSLAYTPPPRALAEVLRGIVEVPEELIASDLTLDSREVRPGAAFLACRGRVHHGLEFAQRAAHAGAGVILWESAPHLAPPLLDPSIVVREVPDLHGRLGLIADRFYDAPSAHLVVDAVTGTNGKTTCAWLLAQALALLGRRSAYLGTLGVGTFEPDAGTFGTEAPAALSALSHTTPDVVTLHRLLAQLLAEGTESVAMEVSSHALDQGRCAGVRLHAAAFTNLTRDHLDYHGDMRAYGAAKSRLFEWPALAARVINVDDEFGRALARSFVASPAGSGAAGSGSAGSGSAAAGGSGATAGPPTRLFLTSRLSPESWFGKAEFVCASSVAASREGVVLSVETSRGPAQLASPLRGQFNADNLLTVLALLLARGVPLESACEALSRCQAPPGRMQPEGGGPLPLALIDYAHTPDALAKALSAARALCTGRLWCVFGCGGERDRGKRAEMGRIAAESADRIIVTDDNPRGEDPGQITESIMQGIAAAGAGARARVIHDRGAAIRVALGDAGANDVVLVAGKGHEDYQLIGAERRSFSDSVAVRAALALRRPA